MRTRRQQVVDALLQRAREAGIFEKLAIETELRPYTWRDKLHQFRERVKRSPFVMLPAGTVTGIPQGVGDAVSVASHMAAPMARGVGGRGAANALVRGGDAVKRTMNNVAGNMQARVDIDPATVPGRPETYGSREPWAESLRAGAVGGRLATDAVIARQAFGPALNALSTSTANTAAAARIAGGTGVVGDAVDLARAGHPWAAAGLATLGVAGMAGPVQGAVAALPASANAVQRGAAVVGRGVQTAQRAANAVNTPINKVVSVAPQFVSRQMPAITAGIPDAGAFRTVANFARRPSTAVSADSMASKALPATAGR